MSEFFKHPDFLRADAFADRAHAAVGQKRKYTGEDYIVHPREVAGIVATVPHTLAMLMAALLHDTVEDTDVTIEDVLAEFGSEVTDLVAGLTDVSKPSDGNRAVRKAIDRQHSADAIDQVQTIKLADLISNSRSILEHDAAFAKIYLHEKNLLLEVLTKGDKTLHAIATQMVMDGMLKLTLED